MVSLRHQRPRVRHNLKRYDNDTIPVVPRGQGCALRTDEKAKAREVVVERGEHGRTNRRNLPLDTTDPPARSSRLASIG